jgi:Fe-S cluster assembly protein SufD
VSATATTLPGGLERLEPAADGHHPAWVGRARHDAREWVAEHGFPTLKDEDWRYTRVASILEIPFEPALPPTSPLPSKSAVDQMAGDLGGTRLVFFNGHLARELSSFADLPPGVRVTSFASALVDDAPLLEPVLAGRSREHRHAFTELNLALAEDGAIIHIPAGTTIAAPIHLVFVSAAVSPLVSSPRSVVLAGARSRATIVETHVGSAGVYLTNAVTEVVLDEGARVEHYKVQDEADSAFHLAALHVRPGRDSSFSTHSLALGGAIARHEVRVRLESEGAEVTLNGLYLPEGEQHHDNPTLIEHVAPRCTSRQLYKGVLDGHGRGVFNGRIVVHPGALGTDASQINKNLLLSDDAEVDTRPRLEILTDDVRCTHGAAVGQLDEDAVFYLRSRGVPHQEARALLTHAFVRELLELIGVGALRSHVENQVAARLRAARVGVGR